MNAIQLSVVVPIFNEEENVGPLYEEIKSALSNSNLNYEILFCNDGSTDQTLNVLLDIAKSDSTVHVVNFRRNFGQTAAMSAGFDQAKGEIVVAMDGDRQNDPKDILTVYNKALEGYDLVSGWRKDRKDKLLLRKIPSRIANQLIGKVTNVELHDYGCSLKAYRKDLLEHIHLYGEMHRFIPVFARKAGAKITEIPVNHRPRVAGITKYGISRTFRVLMDLLTVQFLLKFLSRPLHFFGWPGLTCLFLGAFSGGYLTYLKFFFDQNIGDRPLLLFSLLTTILGFLFISIGLLGEIMTRVYYESTGSKPYVIRDIYNFKNGNRTIDE